MSLTDLKRKKLKPKPKSISADEFISDADNYAMGNKAQSLIKPGLNKTNSSLYRHATFTLTEHSISQLDTLAMNNKLAKSKILRLLIDDFYHKQLLDPSVSLIDDNSH
ncbi:replication protein RepA [Shewanella sp. SR44-3]|uniref:replication protein RepA n=1 Tax=unclassified Shewanella TaxID=196818 RepID=UPI0015FA8068|nr:replication protein RepA [Shewanella sp. SR44-3]MBB1269920.1 replication protein RepA [Shewanella sp. SR44-3]